MAPKTEATASLCPVCLARVAAAYQRRGDEVWLVKTCPEHGPSAAPVWRGAPDWDAWRRPKLPSPPALALRAVERGCPHDCGLCPDHRQHTCTLLVEVTQACDLGCPVCFASAGGAAGAGPDPSLDDLAGRLRRAFAATGPCNLQLSGGEPTQRPDLSEIIALARDVGYPFIQLNTNGLRLASEPGYAQSLAAAGLASVFLQFDGSHDGVYRHLRGRPLLRAKLAAIEACAAAGLGVVLVATVAPGVNDGDLGALLRLGLGLAPTVRGLHLQPIAYFGRYPHPPQAAERITLPELMRGLAAQTDGLVRPEHFSPPGCENARCSFSGNFLIEPGGGLRALGAGAGNCCAPPRPAAEGAQKTIARQARQWSAPPQGLASLLAPPPAASGAPPSLDDFLATAQQRAFSISAMAFMDAQTLDLERARDCCIHVLGPAGGLVPFCLYNLTSATGQTLYRPAAP
ncbi:MAG: radical SAM protein [Pseudomonadota bacterium]